MQSCVSVSLPDLLQLAKKAKELSFSAKHVKAIHSGQHVSRLLGRGMEFAETRQYQPGDDIRTIDWRVTARTGKTHTKLFTAEKERQVLVCVDMRSSMFFATQGVFKSVQAARLAGFVTWNAVYEGNRIGGIIFDDEKCQEIRPMRGKRGALHVLQTLSKAAAYSEENRSIGDMGSAVSHLRRVTRPGSLVFVISDFRKSPDDLVDSLSQISKHSDVVLCFLYDPIEEALPKNQNLAVTNGEREVELSTYQKKNLFDYQEQFRKRKEKIEALSGQRHIHFMALSTQDDCYEVLWKSCR